MKHSSWLACAGAAAIALAGCASSAGARGQAIPATAVAPAPGPGPAGWTLPMAVSRLSKEDEDEIMRAAGYTLHDGQWNAWDDFGADYPGPEEGCPAGIPDRQFDRQSSIRDLNGDHNPEVIVNASGTYCFGFAGEQFAILTWTPAGWRKLIDAVGIPEFYPREGSAWPDIEIGGPGFCFPRVRWSGHDYSADAGESYGNAPCGEGIIGDAPDAPDAPAGGLPIPFGKYAVNESCADAAVSNDYLGLSADNWSEIDGDTPIGPFRDLGGNRWALGGGDAPVIIVTGAGSFIENGRRMTWCAPWQRR